MKSGKAKARQKPTKAKEKSTQAVVQQRVEEVLQIRLLGAEFADVRQHAQEKKWKVGDRQLWRYIEESDALLARTLEKDCDKPLARHVAQRRALFARCMAVSDYSNARAVLKDEAELLGLYPAKRTELTGKDGGPLEAAVVELTDDERRAAVTAILSRLGTPVP
jgi:hypothetical protein